MPDREELLARGHTLVETHGITGFRSYDARIVAAMQTYGVAKLLTFNAQHFRSFPITILDPAAV